MPKKPQHPNHFIGYGTLERWHQQAQIEALLASLGEQEKASTVYANLIEEPVPIQHTVQINRFYAVVSRLDQDNNVHYCRMRLGSIQMMGGRPLNGDHKAIKARVQDGYELILAWLRGHGHAISQALIATPKNLTLLDGRADFLLYDQENKRFYVEEEKEPVS